MSSENIPDIEIFSQLEDFDPEFASPSQWARMYRAIGWQVVPALRPGEAKPGRSAKQPIIKWREHERELISDALFEEWYGHDGVYADRGNMGFITGECSRWSFAVDLDMHKEPFAKVWWQGIHDDNAGGILPETPCQTTGGGGKQYYFRAPAGWIPPTIKTSQGIDIRGRGGFAMLPPSKHDTGGFYGWDDGLGPWEIPVMVAPEWLCAEIDRLVLENGGVLPHSETTTIKYEQQGGVGTTGVEKNDFGLIINGREGQMNKMVFGRMVDEYRKNPSYPDPDRQKNIAIELFRQYTDLVKTRLNDPSKHKHELLEMEGRGITLFSEKMRDALRKWHTKIALYAQVENPRAHHEPPKEQETASQKKSSDDDEFSFKPEQIIGGEKKHRPFETLSVQQIFDLPDPRYLLKDLLIENGLGFIYGAPGSGKSFIALDMALSIAGRLPSWWGKSIERHGPVIYISSEGVSDLKFRLKAWAKHRGVDVVKVPIKLVRETINFMKEDDVGRLIQTVRDVYEEFNDAPAMVVVDTVSRVLPGADENLQKDMTLFIKGCDMVRSEFDCSVLGIHHAPRNGANMRGSTVMDGAGDGIFHVSREEGSMEGQFYAKKIKSAPDNWSWNFELLKVVITPGIISISSLAAEKIADMAMPGPQDEQEVGFGGRQELGTITINKRRWPEAGCYAVMDLILDAASTDEWLSNSPQTSADGRYAPEKICAKLSKFTLDEAKQIVKDMLYDDIIQVKIYDTKNEKKGLTIKNGLRDYSYKGPKH